ncbi:hypothetical protein NEFER03_1381 [Nematocida sp. LUAm3]|nr:hypothetical protein NEFER03_1381 [Nematocida sp. LUAm3]KAI5174789.1 hypothetical protein NEFER02_0899 [Nematocida sp. LUAm2]KAI5177800.1 hypothetical protein NEFER01_1002 [Nematocida sp. LUAm1]
MDKRRFLIQTGIYFMMFCGNMALGMMCGKEVNFSEKKGNLGYAYRKAIMRIVKKKSVQESPLEIFSKSKEQKYTVTRSSSEGTIEGFFDRSETASQNTFNCVPVNKSERSKECTKYTVRKKNINLIRKNIYVYEIESSPEEKVYKKHAPKFFIAKKDFTKSLSNSQVLMVSMVLLTEELESLMWSESMLIETQKIYRKKKQSIKNIQNKKQCIKEVEEKLFDMALDNFISISNLSWIISESSYLAAISFINKRFLITNGTILVKQTDNETDLAHALFIISLFSFHPDPTYIYFSSFYKIIKDRQRINLMLERYHIIAKVFIFHAEKYEKNFNPNILKYTIRKDRGILFPNIMDTINYIRKAE